MCFTCIPVLTEWNRKSEIKRLSLLLRTVRISARVIIMRLRLLCWLALRLFFAQSDLHLPVPGNDRQNHSP